jgi:hypothetical protein
MAQDKVRELSVKGYNQRQIANILKVGLALVSEGFAKQFIGTRNPVFSTIRKDHFTSRYSVANEPNSPSLKTEVSDCVS